MIAVDQPMIGRIGLVELRKALGVLLPGKFTAVDDGAAERGAMAAKEFGQRMYDDIGAVVDRPQQDRRGNGIVDDKRNTVACGDVCQRFDVTDIAGRVADAFAKNTAGGVVDEFFDGVGPVGFGETHGDALARQNVAEQRVGRAVKLRHRNYIGAHRGEIEYGIIQRRLTGACAQRIDPAFQQGNAALQHGDRRIADAAVAMAFDFKVEQRGAVIGAVEFVGDGLIDRHRHRFGGRVGFVAAVNGQCLVLHASRRLPENTLFIGQLGFLSVPEKANNVSSANSKE